MTSGIEKGTILKTPEATSANAEPFKINFEFLAKARNPKPWEQKKLERGTRGAWLFLPIQAKSLDEVREENPEHFSYVSPLLPKGDIPPKILVAVYTKNPIVSKPIINENELFTDLFINYFTSQLLRTLPSFGEAQFPARSLMLPISAIVQLDIAYFERTGKSLLGKSYVCSLDQSSLSKVALACRRKDKKLCIISGEIDSLKNTKSLRSLVFLKK